MVNEIIKIIATGLMTLSPELQYKQLGFALFTLELLCTQSHLPAENSNLQHFR